jgi:TRAP-type C4-dicarboxylate transport system substrate-binding protein
LKRILTILSLLAVLSVAVMPRPATAVTIKLATLVPDRSVWGIVLSEMASEWKEATNGQVNLRIYPGGVAGDDPDIVRKMRIGQLHAGTLTQTGLSEIDTAFNLFNTPLFFRSFDEYFYVLEQLQPALEKRLTDRGFELLHWGHGGWIHLFATSPVESVDDLKKLKLFVWAGSDRLVRWWREAGYKPVPLAFPDVPMGFQTGMLEAMPNTPLAALSFQNYRNTPYMLGMGFAPFIGATLVTTKAWNRLEVSDRKAIMDSVNKAAERFRTEVPEQDAKAIIEMEKRGLTVVSVDDPALAKQWQAEAERFATAMREDDWVPADIYDLAVEARKRYRAANP